MLHETIKNQIKEALRARDTIRLDVLRSLTALFSSEMVASGGKGDFLPDDKALVLIKRSVKQHKDSIDQFQKGGREDLVSKEKAELVILESFMPSMMSQSEIRIIAKQRIDAMKTGGTFDPKAGGKITGMIMKELAGKADGADVKVVIDELLK